MKIFLRNTCIKNYLKNYHNIQIARASSKTNDFFVTTPIFYVNSVPHLGHIYSAVIADASQRFQKLLHPDTNCLFSTGTDEHGSKVMKAAELDNKESMEFCTKISGTYKSVFYRSNIQFTHFTRTTDPDHKIAVQHFLTTLYDKGFIYKDMYEGWYCLSDESFLTENQVVEKKLEDGTLVHVSEESGHPVEWCKEMNYMFKLSSFRDQLLHWLEKEERVVPVRFSSELKKWISDGIHDLSISRPKSRVPWGIPIPWDPDHTTYVWVDALVNYLSAAGYPELKMWPPNLQVIGKDILRFHGIYWPALLMAAGLDPPEKLHVHSHWLVDDRKMSKSLKNVLLPGRLYQALTVDGVRYVLLRNGTPHSDCSWNTSKIVRDLNSELANTLGNLVLRLRPLTLNAKQVFPMIDPTLLSQIEGTGRQLVDEINELSSVVEKHYSNYNYYKGIECIMKVLRTANLFVDEQKPWEMRQNMELSQLDFVLALGLTATKVAGIALQPITPVIADKLLTSLNVDDRSWSSLENPLVTDSEIKLGGSNVLFRKI